MQTEKNKEQGGVSHCGLAILHYKNILRQKKNYENSNIFPYAKKKKKKKKKIKNYKERKSSKRNQNP
jgi:hypothetical protein